LTSLQIPRLLTILPFRIIFLISITNEEDFPEMEKISRILRINLPARQSAFLWGPRKTGKSTYLRDIFRRSLYFDFLKTDLALEFIKRPSLLREQILAKDKRLLEYPVILDEVQKVPQVLDEVHWLIENKDLRFILCGSSARKLKKGKANLLGGRAWRYEMFPLVTPEMKDIHLLKALNRGLIPDHYLSDDFRKFQKSYVQDYLKEEVFAEPARLCQILRCCWIYPWGVDQLFEHRP
jgi:predicted AAA+ superfamily ATPase